MNVGGSVDDQEEVVAQPHSPESCQGGVGLYSHALCSTVTASSLAATLITVICVVLTLKVNALKEADVGWISALVLLVVALLIPTIIIWRQPQSNARLNFKVSAASGSLLSTSLWTQGWCRICQDLLLGFYRPEMSRAWRHSSPRRSPWKCPGGRASSVPARSLGHG